MKARLIRMAVFFGISLLLIFARRINRSHAAAQKLDRLYHQTSRGMSGGDLLMSMNQSTFIVYLDDSARDFGGWWDEDRLPDSESAKIKTCVGIQVKQLYGAAEFDFAFDAKDHLIGRHRRTAD